MAQLSNHIRGPIAIDGPAASGKSTVARRVATRLGGFYLSTGDLYRAVSWEALRQGLDPATQPEQVAAMLAGLELDYHPDPDQHPRLLLHGRELGEAELRSPAVVACVSQVAKLPAVRDWLKERQRAAAHLGLLVMEGRDIGTVIFPDAPFKFFVTASPQERARRRLAQGGDIPADATVATVAAQIAERDHLDSTREVAPLRPAADAIHIDTDNLSIEAVVERIVNTVLQAS